jgi:LysM repeat protein
LATLAVSGFRPDLSNAPVATPTPSPSQPTPTLSPTPLPATIAPSVAPSAAPSLPPTPAQSVAPSPAPTKAPAQFRTYTVKPGDTLSAIAARFDTTVSAIVNLNDLNNANSLRVGQKLKIPN